MDPTRLLYPLEQQLKFCQLQTEVDLLLQEMLDIKQNLCCSNENVSRTQNFLDVLSHRHFGKTPGHKKIAYYSTTLLG